MTPFDIQLCDKQVDLHKMFSDSKLSFYPYGRYAFFELLKVLKIKTIYIPAFICRDILAPINKLNIKYYFYELNEKLEPFFEDIKVDCLLVVNYFGFEQKMDVFKKYCNKNNSILIEDNAHGFLSKDAKGKLLGTRGDFGILSIRKTLFLPNGASLLINNQKYFDLIFNDYSTKETFEDTSFNKKVKLKKIIRFFGTKMGMFILILRRNLRKYKTGSYLPLPDKFSEIKMPLNDCLTPHLKDKKIYLDLDEESKRRRDMYFLVENYAKKFNVKPIFEELPFNTVPYSFPFVSDEKEKNRFENFLYSKSFFIIPWPDLPEEVVVDCKDNYKNIWMVPFLW